MEKLDITKLSYTALNTTLLECNDVSVLMDWLTKTMATGVLYRALRVHGRMSAVRRAQELAKIRLTIEAVKVARKKAA